jgi:lipopolysaccharide/colanic/teichoic acid biosynthesis glycosyltransferase
VTLYRTWGKRALDLAVGITLLLALAPLFAALALLVAATIGTPVLFRQVRPGLNGRPFTLFKFRTMTDARDGDGRLLPDEGRLSTVGLALRRWSLDELPELWNVVRGDMSIVGPRPLLMQYLDRYTPEQARRHGVRPGITGLAQVDGRNELAWDERFRLDVSYVDGMSFPLDVAVLCRTAAIVLTGRGISARGYATMPEFIGPPAARTGRPPASGGGANGPGGRRDPAEHS